MAAPTITKLALKVGGGDTATYTEFAGPTSGAFTMNVDYGTNLQNRTIAGYASAKSYLYYSNEPGKKPFAEIDVVGSTTEYSERIITVVGDDAAANVSLNKGVTIYIVAQNNANLGTDHEITASTTDIGTYTVTVTADLNKIVARNSFTVGLGNTIVLEMSKVAYTVGGIDISKAMADTQGPKFYCVMRADVWDGTPKMYPACYNTATGKLMVFASVGGIELTAAATSLFGTIMLLKA